MSAASILEPARRARPAGAERRMLMAAAIVAGLGMAPKAAMVGKDLLVAFRFGTGEALDAYLIGSLGPLTASSVLSGALPLALVPVYVAVHEREGAPAAGEMLGAVVGRMLVMAAAVAAALALLASPIVRVMAGSISGPQRELTEAMLRLSLPVVLLNAASAAAAAALNALDRFALAALTPALAPVAAMAALSLLPSGGVKALAWATVAGAGLEAGVLAWALGRRGQPFKPRWRATPAVREVFAQLGPLVASTLLMSGMTFVNQSMAARLGPRSVSAMSWGAKIVNLLCGVAALSLGTAVLPYFSRLASQADWTRLRRALWWCVWRTAALTGPAALLVFWFSRPLAAAVFERGAFTAADTELVAQVQAMLAIQIPFYVLSALGVRLLSALGRNRTVMSIAGANCLAALAANRLLVAPLGVAGIALSTSLVYALSTALVFRSLGRELGRRCRDHGGCAGNA